MIFRRARLMVLVLAAACGDSESSSPDVGVADEPDAAVEPYQRLIEANWSLQGGDEGYWCAYKTVDQEMFVKEFSPVIPIGTHHTVLTMGEPTRPDGTEPC